MTKFCVKVTLVLTIKFCLITFKISIFKRKFLTTHWVTYTSTECHRIKLLKESTNPVNSTLNLTCEPLCSLKIKD